MTLPFNPYQEIASIAARHTPGEGEFATAIDSLLLSRRSRRTEPFHSAYRPCVALVLQGAKSVRLGRETLNYATGDYLLTSLELPVAWRVTEASQETPHLCFAMAIDVEKVAALLRRVDIPRPSADTDGMRGIVVNVAPAELLDAAIRLVRLLDRPAEIPAMAPLIEEEILYRVLTGPDGPRLLNIALAESQSNKIARAVAWLRENYARPLRIEDARRSRRDERLFLPSPFQIGHRDDAGAIPEAAPPARGAAADAGRAAGCRDWQDIAWAIRAPRSSAANTAAYTDFRRCVMSTACVRPRRNRRAAFTIRKIGFAPS